MNNVKQNNNEFKVVVLKSQTGTLETVTIPQNKINLDLMYSLIDVNSIEHIMFNQTLAENNIHLWFDEEGKLVGKTPSLILVDGHNPLDIIVGDILFTSLDAEYDCISLSEQQIKLIYQQIQRTHFVNILSSK